MYGYYGGVRKADLYVPPTLPPFEPQPFVSLLVPSNAITLDGLGAFLVAESQEYIVLEEQQ